jgi:hypothetical protein
MPRGIANMQAELRDKLTDGVHTTLIFQYANGKVSHIKVSAVKGEEFQIGHIYAISLQEV